MRAEDVFLKLVGETFKMNLCLSLLSSQIFNGIQEQNQIKPELEIKEKRIYISSHNLEVDNKIRMDSPKIKAWGYII